MSEQIKQVAEALKAAREAYITLFNFDLVKFGITPRSEACRAGEYDDDPQTEILAAAIQAAEVRGYERAVDDAAKIASYGVVPECCNNPSFDYDDWGNAIGGGECCGEPDYRPMTLAEVSLEISTLKKGGE